MDHMCRQSPHARRRQTHSVTGGLLTNKCNGHILSPLHLRRRFPQCSSNCASTGSAIAPPPQRRTRPAGRSGLIHETGDGDSLARWIFLNGWNSGSLTRDGGLVESEGDRMKENGGLVARVGLEVRMDTGDKSGAGSREQTCL